MVVPLHSQNRNKPNIMKKVFAMFAVAGMLFTAACGNKTEEATEETIEVVIEETEEATEEISEEVEEVTEEVATEEVAG
jgi:ABC-type metal ion transport system substrate-binding protein